MDIPKFFNKFLNRFEPMGPILDSIEPENFESWVRALHEMVHLEKPNEENFLELLINFRKHFSEKFPNIDPSLEDLAVEHADQVFDYYKQMDQNLVEIEVCLDDTVQWMDEYPEKKETLLQRAKEHLNVFIPKLIESSHTFAGAYTSSLVKGFNDHMNAGVEGRKGGLKKTAPPALSVFAGFCLEKYGADKSDEQIKRFIERDFGQGVSWENGGDTVYVENDKLVVVGSDAKERPIKLETFRKNYLAKARKNKIDR